MLNSWFKNFRFIRWPNLLTINKKAGVIRNFFYVLTVSLILLALIFMFDFIIEGVFGV